MMRVARVAGFHDEIAVAAQVFANQMRMHGADGKQRMDRQQSRRRKAIREQQQDGPVAYRVGSLRAQRFDCRLQADGLVVVQVKARVCRGDMRQRENLTQLALRQNRGIQQHLAGIVRRQVEYVALQARSAWSAT